VGTGRKLLDSMITFQKLPTSFFLRRIIAPTYPSPSWVVRERDFFLSRWRTFFSVCFLIVQLNFFLLSGSLVPWRPCVAVSGGARNFALLCPPCYFENEWRCESPHRVGGCPLPLPFSSSTSPPLLLSFPALDIRLRPKDSRTT